LEAIDSPLRIVLRILYGRCFQMLVMVMTIEKTGLPEGLSLVDNNFPTAGVATNPLRVAKQPVSKEECRLIGEQLAYRRASFSC
jgi:hypothetical protein